MSGLHDGVSKVWIMRSDGRGGLNIDGCKDLNEAASLCLRTDSHLPGWAERIAAFRRELDWIEKYHKHDHVWTPNEYGVAVCECGADAEEWYCPDSPSHTCDYKGGDGECCIHCGEPVERK
jgi:hypothetical protein